MSVVNISLHFQTFILLLIVIIQWDFCLHKESDNSQCSTQRSDLIIFQSVWNDMKKQNKLRQTNPEELWQRFQDATRNLFTKMSSLSPRLAIPLLQIVIKHLKVSLFVRFLRGVPYRHSLLMLPLIRSAHIKTTDTDGALSRFTYTQIYSRLNILSIHANIICYVLSEHLGKFWGKTLDVKHYIWSVHYTMS